MPRHDTAKDHPACQATNVLALTNQFRKTNLGSESQNQQFYSKCCMSKNNYLQH